MKNKAWKAKTIDGYRNELRRRAFAVLAGTLDAIDTCRDLDSDDGLTQWVMFSETLTAYESIGILGARDRERWMEKFDKAERGAKGLTDP